MLKFFATVDRGQPFEVLAADSIDAALFVREAHPAAARVEIVSEKLHTLRHYQKFAIEAALDAEQQRVAS